MQYLLNKNENYIEIGGCSHLFTIYSHFGKEAICNLTIGRPTSNDWFSIHIYFIHIDILIFQDINILRMGSF